MEIKRTGYSRHEEDCTFISVKHATKIPNTVPVVRIVAQCGGEGETWRDHIELSFFKKVLQMNQLKQTAEYRHGVSFRIPHGTNICDEPGDYKKSGKACNRAKQVWTVRLWGESREDWCLIVHWAGVPNKPDLGWLCGRVGSNVRTSSPSPTSKTDTVPSIIDPPPQPHISRPCCCVPARCLPASSPCLPSSAERPLHFGRSPSIVPSGRIQFAAKTFPVTLGDASNVSVTVLPASVTWRYSFRNCEQCSCRTF